MEDLFALDLMKVLLALASPVGAVAYGAYVSDLARNITFPADKAPRPVVLQVLIGLATVLPPLGAGLVLMSLTPEQLAALQPYYRAFAVAVYAYVGNRGWFEVKKLLVKHQAGG